MKLPRLVIAGTHSGAGKTTVATGLMAALSAKMRVQPFKVGPDYIDPAYHTFITERKSRNLDGWMLEEDVVRYLFRKNMQGAEIGIIEGVMGLYDGAEVSSQQGSTAQIAKVLGAPVVLVVDGRAMAASAGAMVLGYKSFDPELNLAGVIFNNVGGEGHYQILKEAVEKYTGIRVFGYLPKNKEVMLPSRHLGLVPSGEIASLREKLSQLANLIEKTVEVEELVKLAQNWPQEFSDPSYTLQGNREYPVKVAVAYDKAFNFYYWDNLELLEELGATLEFFSPLKDKTLPSGIDAIIWGGGFPEVFAQELEQNISLKMDIKKSLSQGMSYYAECGGLMYLTDSLQDFEGEKYKMVGWLQGNCCMTSRLQRFGYAQLTLQQDCIWGKAGDKIKVHEFHRSKTEAVDAPTAYSLIKQRKGQVTQQWECGYLKGNGVAGYAHLHLYSNTKFAENFLQAAVNYHKFAGKN